MEVTEIDELSILTAKLTRAGEEAGLPQPMMQGWTGARLVFSWATLIDESVMAELWLTLVGATRDSAILETGARCWVVPADGLRQWDARGLELRVGIEGGTRRNVALALGVPEVNDSLHVHSDRPLHQALGDPWRDALRQAAGVREPRAEEDDGPIGELRARALAARRATR